MTKRIRLRYGLRLAGVGAEVRRQGVSEGIGEEAAMEKFAAVCYTESRNEYGGAATIPSAAKVRHRGSAENGLGEAARNNFRFL